jgi:hypothetical protein
MLADYPAQYRKNYPDKRTAAVFKQRLSAKLCGFHSDDIIYGYEKCIESSPKFFPSIPELISEIVALKKIRDKKEQNKLEAEKLAALPAPTHGIDALRLIREAKNKNSDIPQGERLIAARRAHRAALKDHCRGVATGVSVQTCNCDGCHETGGLSGGTNGSGAFYCREHFRQT